jgi:hypothetical protein
MNKTNEMLNIKKKYHYKNILGTIIANIVCSLFIDIQGGRLLFITKTGHTESIDLSSPNGFTPSATNEILTLRGYSLKIGHISSILLYKEPSAGIRRTSSSLLFCAW